MVQRNEHHTFTGMQQDLSSTLHPSKYLCDARNIRLTQREEGNTLLAITNEKGTLETPIKVNGFYLGHCVVGKYLVVFSKGEEDYIERIDLSTYPLTHALLYHGDLQFNKNHLIECLGSYETELVQKVYWTDGENSPRVINIANGSDGNIPNYDGQEVRFDFVPSLVLGEEVTIEKQQDNGGVFPAGVIQYAFTYYNQYGQESNIFYTSELHATSHKSRGGSPEDRVSNSFKITIGNVDSHFDYLRIYSIMRTSLDSTPIVRRVVDIPCKHATTITYTDTGTTGDTVDPTMLLYIGGEDIRVETMTAKDNTLFLGGIHIHRQELSEDLQVQINQNMGIEIDFKNKETVSLPSVTGSSFYSYYNSIDIPPFFKYGEHYRFGVQFQHVSGRWSAPVHLRDMVADGFRPELENGKLTFQVGKAYLDQATIPDLQSLGYIKARGVVVYPTLYDRLVLTQGVLCPTVFKTSFRKAGMPFAMSSWFSRPDSPSLGEDGSNNADGRNQYVRSHGTFSRYEHFKSLVGKDWSAEISSDLADDNVSISHDEFIGVDRSILTMHSPDIEFDEGLSDSTYSGWKLRLVGRALVTSSASDVDIQVSTPAYLSYNGFKKLSFVSKNAGVHSGRGLCAAPLWQDDVYTKDLKGERAALGKYYMVYPWQRQGSLGNDAGRSDGSTQTGILQRKVMSNLKFCGENIWHNRILGYPSISDVNLFDSDEMMLQTIGDSSHVTYYGNVDTLLNGSSHIYIADRVTDAVEALESSYNGKDVTNQSSEHVRVKYKSGKHLFFYLGSSGEGYANTLPVISDRDSASSKTYNIPWENTLAEEFSNGEWTLIQTCGLFQYQPGTDQNVELFGVGTQPPPAGTLLITDDGLGEYHLFQIREDFTESPVNPVGDEVLVFCDMTEYEGMSGGDDNGHEVVKRYYSIAEPHVPEQGTLYFAYSDNKTLYFESGGSDNILSLYSTVSGISAIGNGVYSLSTFAPTDDKKNYSYFWIGELYRDSVTNAFGGTTQDALKANVWLPAGRPVNLSDVASGEPVVFRYGDTYYQQYDCLKTFAFTHDDENSIIDIMSFMCESRVNTDGRYDRNRGKTSNLVMSPVNFNLYNTVYSQKNNFFNYRILDRSYYENSSFPNQITWTKEKQAGGETDPWTNLTLAPTYDVDGSKGIIRSLNTWRDNIYCFQDKGIGNLLFNSRVQIPTSDGVPIEISNSYKVDGYRYLSDGIGCSNKWTVLPTPSALYFIDSTSHHLYQLGDGMSDITMTHNMSSWFNTHGSAIQKTLYDDTYHDVYLVKDDEVLCYSELLNEFSAFMDYGGTNLLESYEGKLYGLRAGKEEDQSLYQMFAGKYNHLFGNYRPWHLSFISNGAEEGVADLDKVFGNIDYRLDFFNEGVYDGDSTFDYLRAWNEYQDTQEVRLTSRQNGTGWKTAKYYPKDAVQKKFRIWRVQIPRSKVWKNGQYVSSLDRIRNPWCKIELGKYNQDKDEVLDSERAILQDLNVQYYL